MELVADLALAVIVGVTAEEDAAVEVPVVEAKRAKRKNGSPSPN